MKISKIKSICEFITKNDIGFQFELASPRYISSSEKKNTFINNRIRLFSAEEQDASKLQNQMTGAQPSCPKGLKRASYVDRWESFPARLNESKTAGSNTPWVVVVDDFCNFASIELRGLVRTIWYQGRDDDNQPDLTNANTELYGGVRRINPDPGEPSAQSSGTAELDFDESRAYYYQSLKTEKSLDKSQQQRRDKPPPPWSHGSAVLSMLTMRAKTGLGNGPDGLNSLEVPKDIDFVQLPDSGVLDTSGGSLGALALDAIHRAVRRACYQKRPAVLVNLSYGTHSGPHDGTSMFERGLLDLLKLYNGQEVCVEGHRITTLPVLHVILPAGNTHIERSHASAWVAAASGAQASETCEAQEPEKSGVQELKWIVQPDTERDSFVEVWIGEESPLKTNAPTSLEIQLVAPTGEILDCVSAGHVTAWSEKFPTEDVLRAAVIYPRSTSKGQNGTVALIAVAPTRRRADFGRGERHRAGDENWQRVNANGQIEGEFGRTAMEAPAGCWTIRLKNKGTARVHVHAWIQRQDSAPGRRRAVSGYEGRQSYFVEAEGLAVEPRFTLNGIATASCPGQLWVVGAMDERGGIPLYSAAGPDRLIGARIEGPDVAVTVDRSRNTPGRHVGGVFSGSRLRLNGTSIAAAAFTRMLYHTLCKQGVPSWCEPDSPAPPPVPTADLPALAAGWLRGKNKRLRHANDLAIPRVGPK